MITGEIRNKIDKIWTAMWAGGITNPLTVIEQLTYLMFIRSLGEKDLEAEQFESILARFANMEGEADKARTEQSFFVSKEEIADNKYDLFINRYKEVAYEKVEYDASSVILDRLVVLNADIAAKIKEFRGRVDE